MICYSCKKAEHCSTFKCAIYEEFSINDCKKFDESNIYKYKKIANNDDLMHLMYDYFVGHIEDGHTYDEAKQAIINALRNL